MGAFEAKDAASLVLDCPAGAVRALAGIDARALVAALDAREPQRAGRRALFLRLEPAATAEDFAEQVSAALAEAARRLWPLWWEDVRFPDRDDALGRAAADILARDAAQRFSGVSATWAAAAVRLALQGRAPRIATIHPARQIRELARVVSPSGLSLVADCVDVAGGPHPEALVRALEWVARHVDGAVVALFAELPPNAPPFDRISYDARTASPPAPHAPKAEHVREFTTWIAPWRGRPHPMSEVERRLAAALETDPELGPLFRFNQSVATLAGARPKVDLVWTEGRLAVEIDGWGTHGNRRSFVEDRHRDYELILSGFLVLRLTNDEIDEDLEKAVEKIRDVVTFCRGRARES